MCALCPFRCELADGASGPCRLRLRGTEQGLEIIGDAIQIQELEKLLEGLDVEVIEQMLCG